MKTTNRYSEIMFPNYRETPKAVIAAIAYSLALRLCEDNTFDAAKMVEDEWEALFQAGIVPQKPKK